MKPILRDMAIGCAAAWIAAAAYAGPEALPTTATDAKDKSIVTTTAPAEPFSWTGFYIGGNAGWNWNDYDFGAFDEDVDQGTPFSFSFPSEDSRSDDDFLGGGQIGFNKQWGHFVLGIEGDFQGTSTGRSSSFSDTMIDSFLFFATVTDLTTVRIVETDWAASARLRAGYALGHWLFYVTGGAAFAEVQTAAADTATTTDFVFSIPISSTTATNISHDCDTHVGWTAGGGIEWAIARFLSIGAEYRHSEFGSENYHFNDHGGPIFPGNQHIDLDSDQVTFKVNLLFCNLFGRH